MRHLRSLACIFWLSSCATTPPRERGERPSPPAPAQSACQGASADCNGLAGDGCETDLMSDVRNCGRCALSCQTAQVAEALCVEGVCKILSCASGRGDCNARGDDGCEGYICYHSHGPSCETRCESGGDAGYGYEF
ncbi:MAG: hypothetical protein U0263_34200 [Polyangiaceae bacterium]